MHSFLHACIQQSFLNTYVLQTPLSALGILTCTNQANTSVFLELTFYEGRQTSDDGVIHAEILWGLGGENQGGTCLTQSGALGRL